MKKRKKKDEISLKDYLHEIDERHIDDFEEGAE